MKNIKGYILLVLAICTTLAIVYLVFQARKLEKYANSFSTSNLKFILFSSDGVNFLSGNCTLEIEEHLVNYIKTSDSEISVLDGNSKLGYKGEILKNIDTNKKNLLLDVNTTNLIKDENTVLIRLGNNNNLQYEVNYTYAKKLKDLINEKYKKIKVNIICDNKKNYYQEYGNIAVRIEVSSKAKVQRVEELLENIINSMVLIQ